MRVCAEHTGNGRNSIGEKQKVMLVDIKAEKQLYIGFKNLIEKLLLVRV